jgi:lysine-N-methylase
MPLPVKPLPVVQHWDCHACGDCCKTYHVRVTVPERARIESQKWDADPAMAGVVPVVHDPAFGGHRLNHRADGSCVFLDPDNRCRIHDKFGRAAKPMACRIYPFVLVPAGDHWRAGVRFGCPSAAADKGRPLPAHAKELAEYAGLLEADAGAGVTTVPPPELKPGQSVAWPDLLRFVAAIDDRLADTSTPLERRLRQVIALADLCKKSKFDSLSGSRLREFLQIVSTAQAEDVPADPVAVPRPGWVGRTVFRQTVALYARKDNGPHSGVAARGRWTRVKSAFRFAVGRGAVPKLHGLIPDTTFAAAEEPAGPLSAASDALLTRYYRVKVGSVQFCGPNYYRRPFWEGLDALLLTFPAVMWLSRVFTTPGLTRDEAVQLAVRTVDDHFGYNKLLGTARQAWAVRALAERGEISRLVAWYGR